MSCFSALSWTARGVVRGSRRETPGQARASPAGRSSMSSDATCVAAANSSEKLNSIEVSQLAGAGKAETSMKVDTSARLEALRQLMDEEGIDAYIVPPEDAHASEYPAKRDQRCSFISGFTGTAGTAIIGRKAAQIFVDGRYYIQAEKQLDANWTLHKIPIESNWDAWLEQEALKRGAGFTIGIDPTLLPYTDGKQLIERLVSAGASMRFPTRNLVDAVWGYERPEPADAPISIHPLEYAGQSAIEKLSKLCKWLSSGGTQKGQDAIPQGSAIILNQLDQIAWILNMRGASIPNTPVFPSYLIIRADQQSTYKATLFVSSKLLPYSSAAHTYLTKDINVEVKEYDEIWPHLIHGHWKGHGDSPQLVCDEKATWAMVDAVGEPNAYVLPTGSSPVALWKAIKNDVEIEGMRNAYLRDGVCWARWAAWLEEVMCVQKRPINEYDAVQQLVALREHAPLYGGMEAYDGISASGENAALPHYETPEKDSRIIDRKTPYLCDSGAQYFDGTIDTTRTVHFGKPRPEHKRAFTRVLQGHIAIEKAVFPRNTTTGATLDVLARHALWQDGCNYMHGTGHGIGSFLGVHEGPQGFSMSSGGSRSPVVLRPNMCLSNEPGFYEEGHYGIRTESIIVVRPVKTRRGFNGADKWLGFERLTVVPIDTKLVDWKLLTTEEAKWLKAHNKWCCDKLLPLLGNDKRAQRWLKRQ